MSPRKSPRKRKPPTPQDFARTHQRFLEEVRRRVEQPLSDLPPDVLSRERQGRLDRLNQRLQAARETRERVVARFDAEIDDLGKRIKALEREIAQDQTASQAAGESAPAPKKTTRRRKKKS